MNELYGFKQEKARYESQLLVEEDEFAKQNLTRDFQDKTKRYLGTALNIISTNFGISYSMNKDAVSLTATFEKINSIARKSDSEVLSEMDQFNQTKDTLNIDEPTKEMIGLAIDVIKIYCTIGPREPLLQPKKVSNGLVEENTTNEIVSENLEQEISNEEVDNFDEVTKGYVKDSPFIIYKILVGLIMIPVVSMLMLVVFLFAIDTFSKTTLFSTIMSNEFYKSIYPTVFYGVIVFLSLLSAGFISAFIKGRTNNKIAFTIIPFSLLLLLETFSGNIISLIKNNIPLEMMPSFIKHFDYSYVLVTLYGLLLFVYLFSVFHKHTKTSIVEIVNILIIMYVGILPGLAYILNIFNIDYFANLINPIYNYTYAEIVSRGLLILCILSNLIYTFIKHKLISKNKNKSNIEVA